MWTSVRLVAHIPGPRLTCSSSAIYVKGTDQRQAQVGGKTQRLACWRRINTISSNLAAQARIGSAKPTNLRVLWPNPYTKRHALGFGS